MTSTKWGALKQQADDASKPLEEGLYTVEVTKAEAVKATTGADMIKATLNVVDGPGKGKTVWTNFVLSTEKAFAMQMFFTNLGAFGLGEDFFTQLEVADAGVEADMATIANTLVGRRATGKVTQREYKGRVGNDINEFKPVSGNDPLGGGSNAPAVPITSSGSANTPPVPNIGSTSSAPTPNIGTTPSVGTTPSAPPDLVF